MRVHSKSKVGRVVAYTYALHNTHSACGIAGAKCRDCLYYRSDGASLDGGGRCRVMHLSHRVRDKEAHTLQDRMACVLFVPRALRYSPEPVRDAGSP